MTEYLLAGRQSERDRLELQARTWEPAGRGLLASLGAGEGLRVVDVGCGCLGWLRLLSEWVGPAGEVLGTDVDNRLLEMAADFIAAEGLANVRIIRDDLFASELPPASFDLVHARFQMAPLGRSAEQIAVFRTLTKPGGRLVLEEPDSASWRYNPGAPALEQLIIHILRAFRDGGGNFDAGRDLPALLRSGGLEPALSAQVLALDHDHPYLRLPLQFSASLEPRLLQYLAADELAELRRSADEELEAPGRWGTTFTLIQACAAVA